MDDEEFEIEEDDSSYDTNKTTGEKLRDLYNENKKLIIIVGVVLLLLIILSIATRSSGPKVKISETEKTITTESGVQLKLLVDDHETSTDVTWESSDINVAIVDNTGGVHGIKEGTATITATYNNEKYKCVIKVIQGDEGIQVETVKFSEGVLVMSVGSTYTPTVEVTPPEARVKNKYFSVSNSDVATVDITSGLVTANKLGAAMLHVSVNDSKKIGSIKIQVIDAQITPGIYILPTSISLQEKEITLTEGERKQITYSQEPTNSSKDYITYISADESIATVENNELIARRSGDVEIVISSFGVRDSMKVHVKKASVEVTSLEITSSTSLTMDVGDTKKIKATISPSDATNKELVFETYDSTIAVVDSVGNVTATGSGSTTIKVSSASKPDIYGTVSVDVNDNSVQPVDPTPYDPTPYDPGGGGSSSDNTVGTVKLTSNNDAVEKTVDAVKNKTMTSTKLTVSKSGNVDKILYCSYEYNVKSDCTSYTVYNGPFEFKTPGTFVFKVIPYYKNNSGTEIIRYVKISGSGGTSKCTAGRYLSGTECKPCEAGNYCSGDKKIACPAGKSSPAYSTMPSDCDYCAKGYYSTGDGTGCHKCPGSQTTSGSGATSSSQCTGNVATSITCGRGTFYNGDGTCKTCPANYYCPGVTSEKSATTIKGRNSCGSGKTSPAGSYDISQCVSSGSTTITCGRGTFYNGDGTCKTCSANYYCPGGTYNKSDTSIKGKNSCGSGKTSPAGSYDVSQCVSSGTQTNIPRVTSYSVASKTYKFNSGWGSYPFVPLNTIKADRNYNLIAFCYYVVGASDPIDTSKCSGTTGLINKMDSGTKNGRPWFKMTGAANKWYVQELSSDVNSASYYFEAQEMNNWGQGDNTKSFILVFTVGVKDSAGRHLSNQFSIVRINSSKSNPFEWPIQKLR